MEQSQKNHQTMETVSYLYYCYSLSPAKTSENQPIGSCQDNLPVIQRYQVANLISCHVMGREKKIKIFALLMDFSDQQFSKLTAKR